MLQGVKCHIPKVFWRQQQASLKNVGYWINYDCCKISFSIFYYDFLHRVPGRVKIIFFVTKETFDTIYRTAAHLYVWFDSQYNWV